MSVVYVCACVHVHVCVSVCVGISVCVCVCFIARSVTLCHSHENFRGSYLGKSQNMLLFA